MAVPSQQVTQENLPQEVETVAAIAEDGLKKVKEVIIESFDTATTEDLQKKAEEHTQALVNQLKTWIVNIKQTTEKYKDVASVKELRGIIDDTIGDLKDYQPKWTYGVTDYVEHVIKNSAKVIEQIKNIFKTESTQTQELTKTVLDITKDSFASIDNQIKDITQEEV